MNFSEIEKLQRPYLERYKLEMSRAQNSVRHVDKYDIVIGWSDPCHALDQSTVDALRLKAREMVAGAIWTFDAAIEARYFDEARGIGEAQEGVNSTVSAACRALGISDIGIYARIVNADGGAIGMTYVIRHMPDDMLHRLCDQHDASPQYQALAQRVLRERSA